MNTNTTLLKSEIDHIKIGRYVYGYGDTKFFTFAPEDRITICSFVAIAPEVCLFGGGMHELESVSTFPLRAFLLNQDIRKPGKGVVIENDVWLGTRAMIMPGVTVHNGGVVGAGSVVTHDVDSYKIVAGNPAREIGSRFDSFIVAALEQIAWWDWTIEEITQCAELLTDQGRVVEFLRYAENREKSPHNLEQGVSS